MKRNIFLIISFLFLFGCGSESESESNENIGDLDSANVEMEEAEEEVVEVDINLKVLDEVPDGCEYEGNIVDAYSWQDMNGTNYFLRTINEMDEGENVYSENLPSYTQYLFAFHFIEDEDGEIELSRKITDFVKDCEFDLIMGHVEEAISLTDLDEDQIGEITFIYRLACTSDVSPSTQKLMLLEDGEKYALRGSTVALGYGGEYESDKAFDNVDEDFLKHAVKLWDEHKVEYEITK